jgi:hypothetical protein
MSILKLYSSNNYLVINRDFAKKHGLNNAVIFGNLCSMASTHDNYFYFTIEDLSESCLLCLDTIKKGLRYLSEKGYITKQRKGIPAKNYFSINEELLESELSSNKMVEKPTNCKVEKSTDYNTSNTVNNIYIPVLEKWNSLNIISHSKEVVKSKWQKKHTEQVKLYGQDKVFKAMENYATIIHSSSYFFDYKWPLWDFIARGLYKFLDEASPLENFKAKKIEAKNASDPYKGIIL